MTKKLRKPQSLPVAGNIVVRKGKDSSDLYVVCTPALQQLLHHHYNYKWSSDLLHTIRLKSGASYSAPARDWKVVHG